jgi:aminoglycoside 3-N-acetyltransferase
MNPIETVSGLALRYLKPEQFVALRGGYMTARKKLAPLTCAIYGTFDAAGLRSHLEKRLGTRFEILMVHSSFNHMQPTYTDSPLNLVRMLADFCGRDRTLVMPAFYFGDSAFEGAAAAFKQRPRFDLRKTPSQMGLVTELFRRSKGALQSRHPVYRVAALGPLASSLTRGHESAESAAGRGSPFDFMANHDTLIIGIGKFCDVLTQVHHAEAILGDAFPVPGTSGPGLTVTVVDGNQEFPVTLKERSFEWRRNMWKLRAVMDDASLAEWRFHHVPMFATRAAEVTAALIRAAKRGMTIYEKP